MGETLYLDCPCCGTPTVPAHWREEEDGDGPRGWCWFDDQSETCHHCGCVVGVTVTDDYADRRVASARTIEECEAPA